MAEEQVLQGLPPEDTAVFQNSGATIKLPSQTPLPPRAMFAALLALLAASAGFYVGMDYLDGDTRMYTHRQLIFTQSVGARGFDGSRDGRPPGVWVCQARTYEPP